MGDGKDWSHEHHFGNTDCGICRAMTNALKCPKCKGKGYYTRVDWFMAVFTLGMSLLMDKSDRTQCDGCDGKGWVR